MSITVRHDHIADLLAKFARSNDCLARTYIKKDLTHKLPDGEIHFPDKTIIFDVSGVNTSAPSYRDLLPGEAVRQRERSKTTKYFDFAKSRSSSFVPFVIDSHGSLGPKALKLLDEIEAAGLCGPGSPSPFRLTRSEFYSRLSSSWQVDNAKIFNEWSTKCRDKLSRARPLSMALFLDGS